MTTQQLCDRKYCDVEAVALIPMPHSLRDSGKRKKDIHVCELHFEEARDDLYFVVRHDELLSEANARHDRLVNAKDKRLRGALAA